MAARFHSVVDVVVVVSCSGSMCRIYCNLRRAIMSIHKLVFRVIFVFFSVCIPFCSLFFVEISDKNNGKTMRKRSI